ncbi:MAG: hypothetical protein A2848_03560 [Candidatus Magasanikbacteria bacterium RIFCSPHIGHO2_01_FULL_50_8]|uniref:Uncharacterized protein n=2 Tax=Candidatus Magasanikiibacteriota TaxID=1752731 RepID=A0A1F6LSN1_9BACT|nr:MAG: hypothetical protein A2848_03560 [Candidatus Magasanikbacteria bacterium RIFCSPHIGHO2_01_FULL_50_8]OGH68023.1 MAG: hypothetical protein A3C15_00515 [Candidatus Magasanikbacteria bacterium RIFCSPHIGHO2_02_FULL_50_9b]
MITFGTEAGTGVTAVQEPVHRIEAHWDAKNFKVSITRSHVVVIKSNTTGATLAICRQSRGWWKLRYTLKWKREHGFGGGRVSGEVVLSTAQLVRAFDLQDYYDPLFEPNALCRRIDDHLTVPAWRGQVANGVPCISIRLSPRLRDPVRELINRNAALVRA